MSDVIKGLLDINVLVAHAVIEHEYHRPVVAWHRRMSGNAELFSCPITELGLVRNLMRMLNLSIGDARLLLANERENLGLTFLPDTFGGEILPDWIQGYRQTTDAYLVKLAEANQLRFVTLDKRVPGVIAILG